MLTKIIEIITVLFWASLKYMFGIAFAATFEFGFVPSVILTVAGGMAGVFFFAFFGKQAGRLWRKHITKPTLDCKVKFGKLPRFIVNVRKKFGLAGIALLTPILFQVPIGTLLAIKMNHKIGKISLYMFASFTLYSVVFCGLYYASGFSMKEFMSGLFH